MTLFRQRATVYFDIKICNYTIIKPVKLRLEYAAERFYHVEHGVKKTKMTKDRVKSTLRKKNALSFSSFWWTIASELGNSRIKINPKAESIKQFLKSDSDHKDFLRKLIQQSYKRCHCYHLNARFDVNVALDLLGETFFTLTGNKEDDLLDIELLEEVAWIINQHYPQHIEMPLSMLTQDNSEHSKSVISLSDQKILRANQKR